MHGNIAAMIKKSVFEIVELEQSIIIEVIVETTVDDLEYKWTNLLTGTEIPKGDQVFQLHHNI